MKCKQCGKDGMPTIMNGGSVFIDIETLERLITEGFYASLKKKWTHNVLQPVLQYTSTESGNPLVIVHAKYMPRDSTTELFSVALKPSPVRPEAVIVPDLEGETRNWVSVRPSEFCKHLHEVLALPEISNRILEPTSRSYC